METLKSRTTKPNLRKSTFQRLISSFLILSLAFQILIGVFLFVSTADEVKAASTDYLTGWNYCTPVVIENSTKTVEITLQGTDPTAPNYIDFDKTQPNGVDIRITDSDKVTQIPHEIKTWDNASKTATVWITAPSITPPSTPPYFKFSTCETYHKDYGLSYPVTYEFNIPKSSSDLKAYKKYTENGSWEQLKEKTSNDFFNGIEAVRFDYKNNKAYVSVAFDADSNDVYLKVVDGADTQVSTYGKIDKYYDNRKAAIVVTGDDYENGYDEIFQKACDVFREKQIWFTIGIETLDLHESTWEAIQSKTAAGYIEPASHTRMHQQEAYNDTVSEIQGSKDDIINNLTLPALNRRGSSEYVYTFIEPGGYSDDTIRRQLGISKYLVDREVSSTPDFVSWDSANGLYEKSGYSIRMGEDGITNVTKLNNKFNSVYNNKGIYHLMLHPDQVNWKSGQYADKHTTYISGKKDIWYAGLGHLYLYDFTRQQASQKMSSSMNYIYVYYGKS